MCFSSIYGGYECSKECYLCFTSIYGGYECSKECYLCFTSIYGGYWVIKEVIYVIQVYTVVIGVVLEVTVIMKVV